MNLAKLGAEKDVKGVVHVGEKGTKQFFKQRKSERNYQGLENWQKNVQKKQVFTIRN